MTFEKVIQVFGRRSTEFLWDTRDNYYWPVTDKVVLMIIMNAPRLTKYWIMKTDLSRNF